LINNMAERELTIPTLELVRIDLTTQTQHKY